MEHDTLGGADGLGTMDADAVGTTLGDVDGVGVADIDGAGDTELEGDGDGAAPQTQNFCPPGSLRTLQPAQPSPNPHENAPVAPSTLGYRKYCSRIAGYHVLHVLHAGSSKQPGR